MVNTLQIVLEDEDFERWYGQPLTGEQGVVPVVWAKDASDLSPEELGEETLLWSFAGPQMVVAGASDAPLPNGIRQKGAEDDRFTLVLVTSRSAFEASGISFAQGEVRSYAVYWDADDGRTVTKVVAPVLAGCGLTYEIQDYTPTGQTVLLGSGVRILLTVFCGGFAAVVLLTSAANILSTVSSSMLQRRRELSLLLSAGMSRPPAGPYAGLGVFGLWRPGNSLGLSGGSCACLASGGSDAGHPAVQRIEPGGAAHPGGVRGGGERFGTAGLAAHAAPVFHSGGACPAGLTACAPPGSSV